jgi:uncharacterized protein (UPF0248 family)
VTRLKWKLDLDRSKILLILTQDRCTVCAERTIASEVILDTHTMVLLGDNAQVEAQFSLFEDSANLDAR